MMETLVETAWDEKSVALDTKTKGAITREWKKRDIPVVERSTAAADEDYDPVSEDELDVDMV